MLRVFFRRRTEIVYDLRSRCFRCRTGIIYGLRSSSFGLRTGIIHELGSSFGYRTKILYDLRSGYRESANFYGVGGMKIFRDLIYTMQGLMREDHRFYKKHGFYKDFPQRHRGKIAAMYLVGAMMNKPALRKKLGGNITRGMLMPYENALKKMKPE